MSSANVVLPTSNIIIEYIDLFHIFSPHFKVTSFQSQKKSYGYIFKLYYGEAGLKEISWEIETEQQKGRAINLVFALAKWHGDGDVPVRNLKLMCPADEC